jgi:hypothetical protein
MSTWGPCVLARRVRTAPGLTKGMRMTSTRTLCTAVICAALGTAALPVAASADETDCVGAIGAATVDNLRVPEGEACVLDGTIVQGTIKVETDATLRARAVRVVGNVQAENAERVVLESSEIGGSVQVKQGGGADVTESRITGDIQLDQNQGATQRVADNDVNGSVQVMKNVGGVEISANVIDGNLQCKENERPPPTGGGNDVQGNAEDQCAALGGGSPGADPGGDGAALLTSRSLRASQSGVVRVPLRCAGSSRCSGRVRLLGRAAQAAASLGSARFGIAAGKSKVVRVLLNPRGRAMMRRASRVRVVVAIATRGHVARRTVTLRR